MKRQGLKQGQFPNAVPVRELADTSERRVCMGEALAAVGRRIGLANEDLVGFESVRDTAPAEPIDFA